MLQITYKKERLVFNVSVSYGWQSVLCYGSNFISLLKRFIANVLQLRVNLCIP